MRFTCFSPNANVHCLQGHVRTGLYQQIKHCRVQRTIRRRRVVGIIPFAT